MLHGFDNSRRLYPCRLAVNSVLTTAMFSPVKMGKRRSMISSVLPWTDGTPTVRIAAFENQRAEGLASEAFQDCDPLRKNGECPTNRSGRYFQLQFEFSGDVSLSYLSGFELQWAYDGEQ